MTSYGGRRGAAAPSMPASVLVAARQELGECAAKSVDAISASFIEYVNRPGSYRFAHKYAQ